jgi:hypothetical protein
VMMRDWTFPSSEAHIDTALYKEAGRGACERISLRAAAG